MLADKSKPIQQRRRDSFFAYFFVILPTAANYIFLYKFLQNIFLFVVHYFKQKDTDFEQLLCRALLKGHAGMFKMVYFHDWKDFA